MVLGSLVLSTPPGVLGLALYGPVTLRVVLSFGTTGLNPLPRIETTDSGVWVLDLWISGSGVLDLRPWMLSVRT